MASFTVEGLETYDERLVQEYFDHMIKSVELQTEGKSESHFAIKLTSLISTDVVTRVCQA